jgi:hypothetical protein
VLSSDIVCDCHAMSFAESAMPPTKPVSLRLAHDVVEWIAAQAKADQRSPAFIVTALVREKMAHETKPRPKRQTKR